MTDIIINCPDGTTYMLTVGNDPILIKVKGKEYWFEILNSGGAERVTKNGNQCLSPAPKVAWIALQCKVAESVTLSKQKSAFSDTWLFQLDAGKTQMKYTVGIYTECERKMKSTLDVLAENGIEVQYA